MKAYRFKVGDRVRICAKRNSSINAKAHDDDYVTIKALCPFTYAYELEELTGLWEDGLLRAVAEGEKILKNFWCVLQKYYDSGAVKVNTFKVRAESKPQNGYRENTTHDEYCDYFDTQDAAQKFAKTIEKA